VIGVFRTIYGRCDNFCNWWPSIPYSRSCYITKLHIPTNNLSIKRDVFQKIGYFNEDLKTGEDADFCFRAIKNGQKIFFKSDLVIYHHDKDSFGGFLRHQETWGRHALKMRRGNNMDFSWILPGSRLTGYLSIPHLSILYTGFIVMKWVKYDLSVLPLSPVILLGKIKQALAIAGSVERAKK
jgi:GT2 family glycosyltransferase